jgi:cytochrome P450
MAPPTRELPDVPLYRDASRVDGYADIDAILRDFEFNAVNDRIRHDFLGETLVHLDGDEHRRMRRVHANLFRRDALDFYEQQYVLPAIDRTIKQLRCGRDADGLVRSDLVHICRETLSDMGCRLIGLGDLEDDARRARYLELAAWIVTGIMLDTSTAPANERAEHHARALAAKAAFWDEFVGPAVEAHRRKETGSAETALDLLDLLLADDPDISDELILRNCSLYISGSQGAVIQSVTHTFNNLCRWLEANPGRSAESFDIDFLRHAAFETLRLTPPQGILIRVAGHDKTLPSGREIVEGERVAMQLGLAHQDPEVFGACPHDMVPEREPERRDVAQFGLAFGAGPHVCIGRRLALPARADDGGRTEGIMLRLLEALYAAGIAPDPDDPAVLGQNTRQHFERYPVIFGAL